MFHLYQSIKTETFRVDVNNKCENNVLLYLYFGAVIHYDL